MQFSARTRYALKLLLCLAEAGPSAYLTADALAENTRVPRRYLEQVLSDLRNQRLVRSRRGAHGGYTLALPPARVTTAHVVVAMEGMPAAAAGSPPAAVATVLAGCGCDVPGRCPLCSLWREVSQAIDEVLARTTLATMLTAGVTTN